MTGAEVRQIRESMGISQEVFAKLIVRSVRSVRDYERTEGTILKSVEDRIRQAATNYNEEQGTSAGNSLPVIEQSTSQTGEAA